MVDNKYLPKKINTFCTKEGTSNNEETANAYMAALYHSTLPSWPVNEGNYADESGNIIGPEWITIQNGTMRYWPYDVVRRVNILLTELPKGNLSQSEKNVMIGHAKFLRAYLYLN